MLAADLLERRQAVGPTCDDFFRSYASLQLLDGFGVSDEQQEFLGIELLRIEPMQNHGNLQAHAHRAHRSALCNAHRYAPATLAAVETDDGDERLRGKMQTGKMTLVQGSGNLLAVEPWRAELLKRSLSTASDGDTPQTEPEYRVRRRHRRFAEFQCRGKEWNLSWCGDLARAEST